MPIIGDKHRFTRKNVELVPEAPGVYALFAEAEVAYFGRAQGGADTIRARLGDQSGRAPGAGTRQGEAVQLRGHALPA